MEKINYSVSNGIATLILDNPKNLNALNEPMLDDLIEAVSLCEKDSDVKVVIISGAGKGFSAGGDIGAMMKGITSGDMFFDSSMKKLETAALSIRALSKPVIASLHGPIAGAGFNLALLCDFRIAAENSKFIQAFVNIGLVPDMGGIFSLTKILGVAKTTELVMTGRLVKADEALSLGLVSRVVPNEGLEEATLELAKELSKKPSIALKSMKIMINETVFSGLEESLKQEAHYQLKCSKTEDFVEGITAFVEKRPAKFNGK